MVYTTEMCTLQKFINDFKALCHLSAIIYLIEMEAKMKTFVDVITYFVFLYPLLMAILWTIAGVTHYKRRVKIEDFEEQIPLTILMPIYNEESDIKEHLLHNLNLDYQNYKVIAIDDKSTDNSAMEIKKITDDKLVFYQNEQNLGKAKTLNKIVKEVVDTECFIVIDSDTKLAPNALKKVNNRIQYDISEGNQSEIAAYTGSITVHAEQKTKVFRMQKIEYRGFIDMIKRSQYMIFKSVMTLSGACSVYNTKAFHDIGYFSEENATEDINISWRYNMAGYRLVFIEDLYASVTTPDNVFDLILQRKRWTNGLLQTMLKNKADFIKAKNFDLKVYTIEILISSFWALSLIFVNLYYITIVFTNYYEDLFMEKLLFPTMIMLVVSTMLAITAYNLTTNDRESKKDLVKYYLLFPFVFFYIQPIAFVLGLVETIKRNTNEKWRRKVSDHPRLIFASIVDVVLNVVILQLILEVFTDFGFVFDQYWKFVAFLIFYIGVVGLYYSKLHLGEKCVAMRLKLSRNPSFYIVSMFIFVRFVKAVAIFSGIEKFSNVYKMHVTTFFVLILASIVLFELVYRINYRVKDKAIKHVNEN